ncbi:MAG: lipase maturation factor family protein [Candidatus Omnitrophica bacterium]|nr:lipase maturation factor family protein [Candidatus Omnitrophota bacterium]
MSLAEKPSRKRPRSSYWLTRFVFLRLLGLVYFFAFLVAANQAIPLIGENGLTPAKAYLGRIGGSFSSDWEAFLALPTLFWWTPSDTSILVVAWTGVALSFLVLIGFANSILMAILWFLYMSIVHIGQVWYGYGWEIQLLETGFLAIFLCPLLDGRPFPRRPPPSPVIWLLRWLTFRIMLGAGLIKIRGDSCWRDLTCLVYHYETQPIPNPLSRYFHSMPLWFHKIGVLYNHLVELVAPFFVFGPRTARTIAGCLMVLFQLTLILSGNLSFLNWLTICPYIACFDDRTLRRVFPRYLVYRATLANRKSRVSKPQRVIVWLLVLLIGWLSIAPVMNLASPTQVMNTSFNQWELVNTYGAFGTVGRIRYEIILEGTDDPNPTDNSDWKTYEFKAKPGDPMRRSHIVSPYHYRVDWQIWFAAMSTPSRHPWLIHFMWKLLQNDESAVGLIAHNPFPDKPPKAIRAELYQYEFAPLDQPDGAIWNRKRVGTWFPQFTLDNGQIKKFVESFSSR